MEKEMSVTIGGEQTQIFMQDGFFYPNSQTNAIHRHQYTEIHILLSGRAEYRMEDSQLTLHTGDMLVIPAGKMHSSCNLQEGTRRMAFQAAREIQQVGIFHPGQAVISLLAEEAEGYIRHGQSKRLEACFALLLSELPGCNAHAPEPVRDREFLLNEYFSKNYYRDITLSDIARMLNVSEKHAARLIRKYTGTSFREALVNRRIEAAGFLIEETDMSLEEIASRVGYKSYSGFWKAYSKKAHHKSCQNESKQGRNSSAAPFAKS